MTRARACLLLLALSLPGCVDDGLRVSPDTAGQGGGTRLRIEGDDFAGHGPVAVYLGPQSVKAIVIESRWLITATVPEMDATGTVDLRLSFGDGTEQILPRAVTIEPQAAVVLRAPD